MHLIPKMARKVFTLLMLVGVNCAVWGVDNDNTGSPALSDMPYSTQFMVATYTPATEFVVDTAAVATGRWYLKTSIPAWATAVANIAGEYDFAPNFSAALTVRYSAWNYGHVNCKFRTFRFQPEVRYWLKPLHRGWFFEGHVAMIAYNVALPSWEYRIQDRKGRYPAIGGGVGFGYRVPFKANSRWAFEAQLGLGIYHLDYNRWENKRGGRLIDRKTDTFCGIDNVALSIVYNLNFYPRR